MNTISRWGAAAALLVFACTTVLAQDNPNPWKAGNYWTVSGIKVKEGHALKYAQHLANEWQKQQEFAKSKGWISGYHVLTNSNRREGEPDVYLVVITDRMVGTEEGEKRAAEYRAFMQTTVEKLQAEAGDRAEYRTQTGSMLLREQVRR